MRREVRGIGLVAIIVAVLAACGTGVGPAPSPPTIDAVGVATDVRINSDGTRYVFADGSVQEVTPDFRELGDGGGSGLVVIGSDAEGMFVVTFPLQADLPPDCYRENGVGIERGAYIELWGILFEKAPGFPDAVEPELGEEYPPGTRFCLNDHGLVTSIIGREVADPVRFDAWTFAPDRRSVTIHFTGGSEFDPDNPCSMAYRGTVAIEGEELVVGIYPEPIPEDLLEGIVCTGEGHPRTLSLELESAFHGTRLRDVAGQLFFLEEPAGLVEITGLPDGWIEHTAESLSSSPTGRWARVYAPADATPSSGDAPGQVRLIQAFGAPADVTGGDLQPDVTLNGEQATFYLWPPAGEMVLVWMVGGDGVALVGNLADFTEAEFVALAESVVPTR